jgi:hypothetical protein
LLVTLVLYQVPSVDLISLVTDHSESTACHMQPVHHRESAETLAITKPIITDLRPNPYSKPPKRLSRVCFHTLNHPNGCLGRGLFPYSKPRSKQLSRVLPLFIYVYMICNLFLLSRSHSHPLFQSLTTPHSHTLSSVHCLTLLGS